MKGTNPFTNETINTNAYERWEKKERQKEKTIECYLNERLIFTGKVRTDMLYESKICNYISLSLNRGVGYIEHIGTLVCDRYEIKEVR